MDILTSFSGRFNELLNCNNVSPKELSRKSGLNAFDIYHWKSKKIRFMPSVDNLVLLADFFECSIEYLIGIDDINHNTTPKPLPPFAENFIYVIKDCGFNFYNLGLATKMGTGTYYDWINGNTKPRIDSLIKISEALGCSLDIILGRY